MTKKEWEQIIGHSIRNDTFIILNGIIFKNLSYEDIVKDIEEHREEYGIKHDTIITKKTTIDKYIKLYRVEEDTQKVDDNKATGIYGIYVDNKLVYIGQTMKSFKERFQSHKYHFNNSDTYLYRYLRVAKEGGAEISLQPLIRLEELKINQNKKLKERDVKMMELALIDLYKPICNIQGRLSNYEF